MKRFVNLIMSAVAFLTRLPVPHETQVGPDALSSSSVFFPLVGLLVSAGAIILNHVFSRFVAHDVVIVIILVFLVAITGGLHEDAMADAADGFGGGWGKDQILHIMRDSRVGSFGVLAIALALLARFVFLSNIPPQRFDSYLVAGQVTCRWTALPLAFFLPPAREQSGQGARIAGKITTFSLVTGTLLTIVILGVALGTKALWVGLAAMVITGASGAYYRRRIGGVTGDCLGATNQIAEVAIYFVGVVLR
ncbi:MAG: adenosylcobinamide-GDP ribazoletransferase [Terriglobia bacterium]|jgi:adenosylcobinamide-GDP ribazoletransferase